MIVYRYLLHTLVLPMEGCWKHRSNTDGVQLICEESWTDSMMSRQTHGKLIAMLHRLKSEKQKNSFIILFYTTLSTELLNLVLLSIHLLTITPIHTPV